MAKPQISLKTSKNVAMVTILIPKNGETFWNIIDILVKVDVWAVYHVNFEAIIALSSEARCLDFS
jgi:hypothetical protein